MYVLGESVCGCDVMGGRREVGEVTIWSKRGIGCGILEE